MDGAGGPVSVGGEEAPGGSGRPLMFGSGSKGRAILMQQVRMLHAVMLCVCVCVCVCVCARAHGNQGY